MHSTLMEMKGKKLFVLNRRRRICRWSASWCISHKCVLKVSSFFTTAPPPLKWPSLHPWFSTKTYLFSISLAFYWCLHFIFSVYSNLMLLLALLALESKILHMGFNYSIGSLRIVYFTVLCSRLNWLIIFEQPGDFLGVF